MNRTKSRNSRLDKKIGIVSIRLGCGPDLRAPCRRSYRTGNTVPTLQKHERHGQSDKSRKMGEEKKEVRDNGYRRRHTE